VYVLFEWNPSGLVVYAPLEGRLTPLGCALYKRKRSVNDFSAYFNKFDGPFKDETMNQLITAGSLPWNAPLLNVVENVVFVDNPFLRTDKK
jgi:hypothetical protein